jgi:hypothetical protein
MTFAELIRVFESKNRTDKAKAQERASFDYLLADFVGRSVARIYSSTAKLPDLSEAYPSLFDSVEIQEKRQEQKDQLSILRFKHYAENHNKKMKGGADVK